MLPSAQSSRQLYERGLELWGQSQFGEASGLFSQAIAAADSDDLLLPEYHQSLAHVLVKINEFPAAEKAFREALRITLQFDDDSSSRVAVARYFLGEHLLLVGRPSETLEVTAPSIAAAAKSRAILHFVRALPINRCPTRRRLGPKPSRRCNLLVLPRSMNASPINFERS